MSAIHCSKCRQELPGDAAQKPDGIATTIRLCPLCEDSFRRWSSDGLVPGESASRRSRSLFHRRSFDPRRGAPRGLKQLTLKGNKQRMKSTLVAVALVLAILYGLKAFTRAVARPIERDPVTCAKYGVDQLARGNGSEA